MYRYWLYKMTVNVYIIFKDDDQQQPTEQHIVYDVQKGTVKK